MYIFYGSYIFWLLLASLVKTYVQAFKPVLMPQYIEYTSCFFNCLTPVCPLVKIIELTWIELYTNLYLVLVLIYRAHVNYVSVHPSGRLALSVSKDKTLRLVYFHFFTTVCLSITESPSVVYCWSIYIPLGKERRYIFFVFSYFDNFIYTKNTYTTYNIHITYVAYY